MRIIYAKDYEELSKKAANFIAAQVIMKPDCVLGLATGSSPIGTYKCLIEKYNNGEVDFSKVRAVNLDEYCGLPKTNDQSYAYFMNDNLFKGINIDPANTNIPDGTNPDVEAECKRYDAVVKSLGGVDLQLLGIGNNGHIAFNEPADSFSLGTNCVNLTQSTIDANKRFFASADEVPKKAYTMGVGTIMSARKILMVANGEAKSDIICEMATGKITPQVPASILQIHNDVTVICDEKALKKLMEVAPDMIEK